jgi:hypothetical protein
MRGCMRPSSVETWGNQILHRAQSPIVQPNWGAPSDGETKTWRRLRPWLTVRRQILMLKAASAGPRSAHANQRFRFAPELALS